MGKRLLLARMQFVEPELRILLAALGLLQEVVSDEDHLVEVRELMEGIEVAAAGLAEAQRGMDELRLGGGRHVSGSGQPRDSGAVPQGSNAPGEAAPAGGAVVDDEARAPAAPAEPAADRATEADGARVGQSEEEANPSDDPPPSVAG